jgi:hypothetical protein
MVLVVSGLGEANCLLEIFVGKSRIQDSVAVVFEEGRFLAARNAGPSVEEEDSHRLIVALLSPRSKLIE